ncbi:MAG TPA: hypothetical protein VG796_26010 [Verrucomicrobiales bacterium]|nr:hypothetical protein [Verrucomicrobiales bacterium]
MSNRNSISLRPALIAILTISILMAAGCRAPDPAAKFIAEMDRAPAAKRPPDWERTKRLMARTAPKKGQPAPDFSLRTLDGSRVITRSSYQAGRPLVLIFGSFT